MRRWKDRLPGGRADLRSPLDFDSRELARGVRVEMEHTDDPLLATEIAMDHLEEDPDYYRKLAMIHHEEGDDYQAMSMMLLNPDRELQELRRIAVTGSREGVVRYLRSAVRSLGHEDAAELLLGFARVEPHGPYDRVRFLPGNRVLEIDNDAVLSLYEDGGDFYVSAREFDEDGDYWDWYVDFVSDEIPQLNPFSASDDYPWLSLRQVQKWVPLMEELGVSEVARKGGSKVTGEGFLQAYKACGGRKACMERRMATSRTTWAQRRAGFVARHMAQVENRHERLWRKRRGKWEPTRRHLGLIAWAFSPMPSPPASNPIPEAGDRIELLHMDDPYPIRAGTRGTVTAVRMVPLGGGMLGGHQGGFFQIDVDWDDGRRLMLSIPPDRIRILRGRANPRKDAKREFFRLLHENGARLLRSKRHRVFVLPDGKRIVVPASPSDKRAWKNALSRLKKILAREGHSNPVSMSGGGNAHTWLWLGRVDQLPTWECGVCGRRRYSPRKPGPGECPGRREKNPDNELRRLERAAASGDRRAQERLERARERRESGPLRPLLPREAEMLRGYEEEHGWPLPWELEEELLHTGRSLGDRWDEWEEARERWIAGRENPDVDLRRLERAAAAGDRDAKYCLLIERARRGLTGRMYLVSLAEQAGHETWPSRRMFADGIRSVLKAAGIPRSGRGGVTVRVPTHAWAQTVDLRAPKKYHFGYSSREATHPGLKRAAEIFGDDYWGGDEIHLYVWNGEDKSDPYSDYFHPGGPSLPPEYQAAFLEGLGKKAVEIAATEGERKTEYAVGDVVRLAGKRSKKRWAVAGTEKYGTREGQLVLKALSGSTAGSEHSVKPSEVILDENQTLKFTGKNARRLRDMYEFLVELHSKKNPDEDIRRLEREASTGDQEALARLRRARARLRPPSGEWVDVRSWDRLVAMVPLRGSVVVYGGPGYSPEIPAGAVLEHPDASGHIGTCQWSWHDSEGMKRRGSISNRKAYRQRGPHDLGQFNTMYLKRVGKNPDEDIRRLERSAHTGDMEALARLRRARDRLRPPPPTPLEDRAEQMAGWSGSYYWTSSLNDHGEVGYSELAMHCRIAGKNVVQYALFSSPDRVPSVTYALVMTEDRKVTEGLPHEVLPAEVLRSLPGGFHHPRIPLEALPRSQRGYKRNPPDWVPRIAGWLLAGAAYEEFLGPAVGSARDGLRAWLS